MIEFDDVVDHHSEVHPALDVVNGVLYVTVLARLRGEAKPQELLIRSDGETVELYAKEQWLEVCNRDGLYTNDETDLEGAGVQPRWSNRDLKAIKERERLDCPEWRLVYLNIRSALKDRLVLSNPEQYGVLALYVMATYFHPLFEHFPLLHLRGPAESGKSRASDAIEGTAFNAVKEGDATTASTFRTASYARPTHILTECDHLSELDSSDRQVRQLLNVWSRSEAYVTVNEPSTPNGKTLKPKRYYSYCPRILLSTKKFRSHPLRTRCIELDMVKKPDADQDVLRREMSGGKLWAELREQLYRLQVLRWKEVKDAQDTLKEEWRGVKGRTFDNWLPIATMAALVGEDVLAGVKATAAVDFEGKLEEASYSGDAILFKFAAYVARREQEGGEDFAKVSLKELWAEFSDDGNTFRENGRLPPWQTATGVRISQDEKLRYVRSELVLSRELKRLGLIEKDPSHKAGRLWRIRPQHVLALAREYMGNYIFVDQEDSAA